MLRIYLLFTRARGFAELLRSVAFKKELLLLHAASSFGLLHLVEVCFAWIASYDLHRPKLLWLRFAVLCSEKRRDCLQCFEAVTNDWNCWDDLVLRGSEIAVQFSATSIAYTREVLGLKHWRISLSSKESPTNLWCFPFTETYPEIREFSL